jgi:hypothetical protein
MIFNGNLACDVLDIYGLKTPHTILDADDIYTSGWFSLYTNPVLGFARHRPGQSPSPWQSLVSGELLDRNVFSVVPIPGLRNNSKPRTGGELVIGAYPSSISDDDEKDAIRLPLKMNDEQYSWATSLEHMTFAGIRHSFPSNSTAFFSTVDCFILVPKAFGRLVLMWVGNYEPAGWFFVQFACEKRQKLPDWTFGIGGKNITLTPYQYVTEVVMIDYEDPEATPVTKCLLGLFPGGDYEVGLGWPFWEKFRGISFDEDSEIISLFP